MNNHFNNDSYRVYLRKPTVADLKPLKQAYSESSELHGGWTFPPDNYEQFIAEEHRYLLCDKKTHAIVGTFNISGIVRGWFQSAYLGYEAFAPHQRNGFMYEGMQLLLAEAFYVLNLHRLEANIQPDNTASIAFATKAGFYKEGFSPKYLRIGGKEWKDHERWTIINENWIAPANGN